MFCMVKSKQTEYAYRNLAHRELRLGRAPAKVWTLVWYGRGKAINDPCECMAMKDSGDVKLVEHKRRPDIAVACC
jgi:hypothetical protein